MAAQGFTIVEAAAPRELAACRELFLEYRRGLGVSLDFQGFDAEVVGLPGDYAPPRGRLWLARSGHDFAGCVAIRPLGIRDAEMKRLYVRPACRGERLGERLAECAIREARALGYRSLRLDTLPAMKAAQDLYVALGFVDVPAYYDNPIAGTRFLALELNP